MGNTIAQTGKHFIDSEKYVCFKVFQPILIDGNLIETEWDTAPWTSDFQDIKGDSQPIPELRTRVKMLWDDNYFYIAAELIEHDIWATYTDRDAVIFHENDFEVFIDPDGDTHQYYELEINALGTVWDLFLVKPYRNGGPAINSWDIRGLKKAIKIFGTINNSTDVDSMWTIELAMPWEVLKEAAPNWRKPQSGEQWRVNFSRVNWQIEPKGASYKKKVDSKTGKPFPEFNWVWSPQGVIAMHRPETWGYVQFADQKNHPEHVKFIVSNEEEIKKLLRYLYYRENEYYDSYGSYTDDLKYLFTLPFIFSEKFHPRIEITSTSFIISHSNSNQSGTWYIKTDGKIWEIKDNKVK